MRFVKSYRFALAVVAVALLGSEAHAQCLDGGVLRMRDGPGQDHWIVGTIPIPPRSRVRIGQCVNPDDGVSQYKWCLLSYEGVTGWSSACGLPYLR